MVSKKKEKQINELTKIMRLKDLMIFVMSTLIIGATMNFYAVLSNDCKMPVKLDYSFSDNFHKSFNDFSEVKYPILSDIFSLGIFYFSIGDLIMFISISTMTGILFYHNRLVGKYKRKYL